MLKWAAFFYKQIAKKCFGCIVMVELMEAELMVVELIVELVVAELSVAELLFELVVAELIIELVVAELMVAELLNELVVAELVVAEPVLAETHLAKLVLACSRQESKFLPPRQRNQSGEPLPTY